MEAIVMENPCVMENKLSQNKQVDLQDDEGEIMLPAMILLQLYGVKTNSSSEEDEPENKKKRQRTSPDQLAILEQIFQTDKMPNQQTRIHLADQLGMSSRRVQIWFQNKRAKVKRSSGAKPDDSDGTPSLHDSSSSVPSSPSSPVFPPSPSTSSPTLTAAVVPQLNPLKRSISSLENPIIITPTVPTISTLSTNSPTTNNTKQTDNTSTLLKTHQFSRAPFADSQPVLTASY